jgi:uncharacterized peroxidase-related enzyme
VADDYRSAPLTGRERAICDYAAKLTLSPWEMEEADLAAMRGEGLTDRDILDVNLITSYFAYVNRLADGLGIALEGGDEVLGW